MVKNSNIYMMVTFLEESVGGVEMLVTRTAKKMVALGENISIITSYFADTAQKGERFRFKKSMDGITIYRIPAFHGFTMLNTFLYLAGSFMVLLPALRKTTVLHAFQVYSSGLVACLIKNILKLKVIVQDIGGGDSGDVAELKRMPFSRFFIGLIKQADLYISPSSQITEELTDVGFTPDKIKKVSHGVDTDIFNPWNDKGMGMSKRKLFNTEIKNVTFVGRLVPEKRPFFLLETWKSVIKEYPKVQMVIIGKGRLEDELKKYCREKGLESSIKFMGVVGDVLPYYGATDVFILPSSSEGVSIALLEAMSCGLPVVASNIPGNAEIIQNGKNGLLFDVENRMDCAQKIVLLLKDEQLADRLRNEARRTIEELYSSDIMTKSFIEIYRKIFAKSGKQKSSGGFTGAI